MYFNHQDKDINIIKGGKKKNTELSLTLGLAFRTTECLCNQLQATMEQQ